MATRTRLEAMVRDRKTPRIEKLELVLIRGYSLTFKQGLLTAAGGIHAGKSQEVDHAKTLRRSVMGGERWYPTWLDA